MKKIKALHIGSFSGNIGDNASHSGLYSLIEEFLNVELEINEIEIRKAYENYSYSDKLLWNENFINLVNQHDLTVIGGGNYLAPWIEYSSTGTMFDLNADLIKKIKKPFVFSSVGFDPYYKGYTENTLNKFKDFVFNLSLNKNCLLAVRNDGSIDHIKRLIDDDTANRIIEIPDTGFFISNKNLNFEISNKKYIAINLAIDMLDKRFENSEIDYKEYLEELKEWIIYIYNKYKDLNFVFVPHIYSDLSAIMDLVNILPDKISRENICVSPYFQGKESESLFNIYFNAELVVGNRFHTNVCSISRSMPIIGLGTYKKLKDLYNKLGLQDLFVDANKKDFSKKLIYLSDLQLLDKNIYKNKLDLVNLNLKKSVLIYIEELKKIIKGSNG